MTVKTMEVKELNYTIGKRCLGQGIVIKFPCMRKEKDFSIYPSTYSDKYIYLQSDNSCCAINKQTGKAYYSNKGSMPMDYYLQFKRTHEFELGLQIVKDIENALNGDKRINEDGSIMMFQQ